MSDREINIFENDEQINAFLLDLWEELAEEAIDLKGSFTVALSGGGTPKPFYEKLTQIDSALWKKTHIFLVDDRFVPYEHKDSNFGMLKDLFLSKVDIPKENIHPIPFGKSIEDCTDDYENEIKSV